MKERCCRGRKVALITCGIVIALVLLIAILAFTVFKPKKPITKIDSISLKELSMDFNILGLKMDLNVTLDVDVSIENTNKFGFKYYDTTALLNYRGSLIGEAPLPSQDITPGETKGLNLSLTIMADRFLSNSMAVKDVSMGTLPLNTFLSIKGQVSILGFIKVTVVPSISCDFKLNLFNSTVGDKECKSTIDL